jgi:hypothetical protein
MGNTEQRDQWAVIFANALLSSHHRDWSEETVAEVALICADAVMQILSQTEIPAHPAIEPPDSGYM